VFNSIDEKIKPKLKVKQEYKEYSTLQVKETIKNILSEVEKSSFIPNEKVEELLNQIAVVFDETKKDEIEKYFAKFDYENLQIKLHELIKEI
jgi:methyl coenzyme M reductase subunit C